MKRKAKKPERPPLELPEGHDLPGEANPGGTEGADPGFSGGASNVGEVLNPQPRGTDTTYSTKDMPDIARRESVRAFHCEQCGQAFESEASLNVHRSTTHRPRS